MIPEWATVADVETWMLEGRVSFDEVEEWLERWNALPGRLCVAVFDRGSWRSGIRMVLKDG